jgi:hypothetical protein
MPNSSIVELHGQRTDTGEVLVLRGREAWTVACLIEAGVTGITPLERPAPRWSAYVHTLRKRGLAIETVDEHHAGPYPGAHGRYVLRTPVTVLKALTAEEKRQRRSARTTRKAQAHNTGSIPHSGPSL